ncbi:hypothetical protein TURU_004888 [Turdus rufiventris]|nr:hypothetical protein TURU_004888 [Turdus rufiventris]
MASQKEDTQQRGAKAELLAEAFQKEGLDAGYWLPKVSQILGIECREALQDVEYKDYLKLECEARHPWEKKALRKLLKIADYKIAAKDLQKDHMEKTKQRQQVAKQALKDLTVMLWSYSHSQDALRKKAETLWRAMEIPKEFWPSPKKPFVEMLDRIYEELEQQQEMSAGRRENIPDTEVLRRASRGLALQGIYRTSRAGDVLERREQLLRVPEGFQLTGPEQGSLLERREFSSSEAEHTFTKSMMTLGFSMSISAQSAFWGINLGADVDHSSSSQSQGSHQSHSDQSYFCTTKMYYVPLASCYFQRHQLRLSDVALQRLQAMEWILRIPRKEDNPTFVEMCERFFSRDHGAQLQFLQDISAVNVALVSDLGHMDNRGKKLLQELWQSQRPLVCLLPEGENIATGQASQNMKIGIKNRNEAELMDQLTKIIRNFLEGSNPCFSLEACADKARQHGFAVDVDQPACVTAKAKAKELVKLLKKEKLSQIKSQLLPLQGKLWHQWCKKDKELTRLQEKGNKSIEHHRSQIEYEKKAIRRKQLEQAFPLNSMMKSFLGFLQAQPPDTKKYFLQWMKVFMDELSCGRLEELRRYYHMLWTEIQSGKKNKKNPKVNDALQSRLDATYDEINDSSIGLEHLLREVGQIYEALEIMNSKEDNFVKLPEIAAELMVSGYPVELMDGDASYLPLCWVGAIFDSLIERLGDKRVFVLSVLGIQSTGKSTLLNAIPLEHQEESNQEHVKDPHGHSWDGNSLPALSREHKVEQHRTEESLLTRR